MATTPDLPIGTRVTYLDGTRTGTVRESWEHSAGVQWDDAKHAVPWYRSDALRVIGTDLAPNAPTDRERAEMYRAEMSRLRESLRAVTAQRDTLAQALLSEPGKRLVFALTVLTDLVESGTVTDDHRYLS